MKRLQLLLAVTVMALTGAQAESPREHKPELRKIARNATGAKLDSLHSFDVKSYTFWIGIPMTNDSLYGHVRIGATAMAGPLTAVKLNSADLTIDTVRCDGSPAPHSFAADTLTITTPSLAAGSHFVIDIYYRLGNRAANIGYYWYQRDGSQYGRHNMGYSMAEPQDARSWAPCFDEQWDKADSGCVFYVTAPDSYAVASNGLLQDTVRSGGKMTWHWKESNPISTYLMCFTASRYARWSDTARTAAGDTVPLNYFIWPEDSTQSRSVFATVPGMIDCFAGRYHRYPFEKYGMAAAAPFDYGGMEHQTMTTIHEYWIPYNDQYGIAHELAHQWFGDMITCGTWGDIWLNEGFASYSEALYDEYIAGRKPGVYMANNFSAAKGGNAETYPIYNEPMSLVFDVSMEYDKGAWVLQQLRGVMGDSAFFAGMHAYCDSFAYGNAVTAEFQRIMEHQYGAPLGWFFDEWVYRAGHPSYGIVAYYDTRPGGTSACARLRQTSTGPGLFKMPVQLACSTAAGIGSGRFMVWDSTAVSDTVYLTDTLPVKRVMCDPDNWVLQDNSSFVPSIFKFTVASHRMTVYWHRYAYDPSPVGGYTLYRSTSAAGPFTRINQGVIADTVYADTGLVNGTRYYYEVAALMGADTNYATKFSNIANHVYNGVESGNDQIAIGYESRLEQNRPNPFDGSTTINYQLAAQGMVKLRIYNVAGQLVRTLIDMRQPAGRHAVIWNGNDAKGHKVAAGLYYYRLEADGIKLVRSLQYIK